MESIREYVLSVVTTALICSCVKTLFPKKGAVASIIGSLSGILMVFVLISPLVNFDISGYSEYFAGFQEEANVAVQEGKKIAASEQKALIKQNTEAYVLDKAISLGAEISVSVGLSEELPPTPIEITIKGAVSPYVKRVLKEYIKEQLGIPEEAQFWT